MLTSTWSTSVIKHYTSKGYIFTHIGDEFTVKIEDLTHTSSIEINCKCDICGKEFKRHYYSLSESLKQNKRISCGNRKCRLEIQKDTCIKKYGVESAVQNEKVKNKIKNTRKKHFGKEENPEKHKELNEKIKSTYMKHFGKNENPEGYKILKKKIENTFLKKYGVKSSSQNKEIMEKIKKTKLERYGKNENPEGHKKEVEKRQTTNLKRYGVKEGFLQPKYFEQIKEKANKKQVKTQFFKASRQQIFINNLLNGQTEYVCGKYILDIKKDNFDIEYDGGGHTLSIKMKVMTKEQFYINEEIRNNYVINKGYKIIRYISDKDILFKRNILKILFDYCFNYLKNFHCDLIYIDVDNFCIRTKNKILEKLNCDGNIIGSGVIQ